MYMEREYIVEVQKNGVFTYNGILMDKIIDDRKLELMILTKEGRIVVENSVHCLVIDKEIYDILTAFIEKFNGLLGQSGVLKFNKDFLTCQVNEPFEIVCENKVKATLFKDEMITFFTEEYTGVIEVEKSDDKVIAKRIVGLNNLK